MRNWLVVALCFMGLPFIGSLGAEPLPLQNIMSQQDMQDIGVDKLKPEQRAALERWAGTWTQNVLNQSQTYRPGMGLNDWIQNWPSFANPTKTTLTPEEAQQQKLSNQVIERIRNNGQFIDLKDGSVWQISPFYRSYTIQWNKNQPVEVTKSNNSLHPWSLKNLVMNQAVDADQVQASSPTGRKQEESQQAFTGAVQLQSATALGDYVTLVNGTSWKIAPSDIYKVRNWTPYDRIRIEPSDNFLYTYRLTNLETGEVALANPKK